MPFKQLKKDEAESLTLEWVLQTKTYQLTLNKNRCVGCQICFLACPKEAVTIQKQEKIPGENAQKAKMDFDLSKCNFCGICDVTCPYGAIEVTLNGSRELSVLSKESFPKLIRDIYVDTRKCDRECAECETVCPLSLIKILRFGYDGKPVKDFSVLSPLGRKRVQVILDIQNEYCPTCRLCEFKCPAGAIRIKKMFEGTIKINQNSCPQGCKDCLDVCPITGALFLAEDQKVYVNELFCTYCGACKNVCPEEQALILNRTKVLHTPVRSGAWNKALERITSSDNALKEFKAQAAKTRRHTVEKRFFAEKLKK